MSKGRISVAIPASSSKLTESKNSKQNKKHKRDESSSEEDLASEIESDGSSDIQDDEVDLDELSSRGDNESEDSESDSALPKLKKRKKNKDDGSESFANAVTAILGSKLKAYDRKDPILARAKQTIKKAESDKLEAKARRELLAEKKKVYDKDRIRDLLPKDDENARAIFDHERKLKKVAQRGVIRLFNVLMSTQTRTTSEASKTKTIGVEQKEKLITELSKEKFFDLVKAAGK